MSQFMDFRNSNRAAGPGDANAGVYCEQLPMLSEALQGVWGGSEKGWLVQPHTLSLWLDGQYVKFCLSCGDHFPKFFSSFKGLDAAVESVEECLREKRGDWRQPRVRMSR